LDVILVGSGLVIPVRDVILGPAWGRRGRGLVCGWGRCRRGQLLPGCCRYFL